MSAEKSSASGLVVLVIVIVIAFMFITPFFPFSCSRVFLHDFMGMDHTIIGPGMMFTTTNFARVLPLLFMLVLWGAVALWAYHDAERRGQSGLLWGLFVFVGNIIGLIVYLIVRVSSTETSQDKPGVTMKCPGCSGTVRSTYVACPYCGVKLGRNCDACGKRVEAGWKACPYCGKLLDES